MLGEIDFNKKPIQPKFFLAKPDRTIIAKLSEAYNVNIKERVSTLNELSLDLPYEIDFNHKIIRNKNVDLLKERYQILAKLGNEQKWYIIHQLEDKMDESKDVKTVKAILLPHELRDKTLRSVKLESKNAKQALNTVLSSTLWSLEYLDADFELTYRDFDFPSNTVLDAVDKIAETFNAVIQWNTEARTLSLVKPEFIGINRGLKFSYGKYMKTLAKESRTDEMVTRLKAFGKDGMSIESVNSTGQNFLEDFSYFMYPFERDANRNVINHSEYMSDSLCHALLNFEALINSKKDEFSKLLKEKEGLIDQQSKRDAELKSLKNQEKVITDIQLLQQFDQNMWFYKFNYNGARTVQNTTIRPTYFYAVLGKVSDSSNITISLDGNSKPLIRGQWTVFGKIKGKSTTSFEVNGSAQGTEVFIQIANITEGEYTESNNEAALIEKYNVDNKQMQITAKQNEIKNINDQIALVNKQIGELKKVLAAEHNFTKEQIIELNPFIIEKEFVDEKFIDPKDLMKAAKEKFEEIKRPQTSIKIDIVNFLEVVEEQRNWDKLRLGDEVIIQYERFNTKVTARIIEIEYDFENFNINLTIANVKEIDDKADKLAKYINRGMNTAVTVDISKNKWTNTIHQASEISEILDRFWNKVTNTINMANNEFVDINRKGLTITDPNDPMRFLRATHGAIGLTRSGGLKYETAISPDGVIAEMVLGKLILGERVTIGDPDGVWLTEGPKTTITDRCGREVMKLGLYDKNPDKFGMIVNRYASDDCSSKQVINQFIVNGNDGIKITQWNGKEFKDKFYADTNGLLMAEDMTTKRLKILSDTNELMLDSFTKYMDIGKFDNIITDGKLTAIEKLQVKGERERIISEYQKLLAQAETYKTTSRDNTIRIDPTPFTARYNELIAYLNPLLSNMDETTVIDRNEFIQKFKRYYDEVTNIVNAINDSIKYSSLQLGSFYNDMVLDALDGITVTRNDKSYRTKVNATEGLRIQKNIGTQSSPNWSDRFFVDTNGNLTLKGHFQAGDGERVFTIDDNGLALGSSTWANAPFRADYHGNVYMNRLTADTAEIKNSYFRDGHIVGSDMIIGAGNQVFKAFLNQGIWLGHQNFNDAPFSVTLDGVLKAKKAIITNGKNELLMDSEKSKLYMNNWDIEGVGKLVAEMLAVNTILADKTYVNNLTVNKLKTLGKDADIGSYQDFIDIQDNYVKFVTARVSTKVQSEDSKGRKLWWTDSTKQILTTQDTGIIAYAYGFDDIKEKRVISFKGSGASALPIDTIGEGDGGKEKNGYKSGVAVTEKFNGGYRTVYAASNTADERSLELSDDGFLINSEKEKVSISSKDLFASVEGEMRIKHKSGSYVEFTTTGDIIVTHHDGSFFKLENGVLSASANEYNFA
ncbi:hypothetical protein Elgi_36440 [Paenibacillus elgii]|uniref:phage tail spike protein n=1 Tax=Paenibacillus elgii TaxID=189691 RepID=UPI002D7C731B|nr:hypothetical protein Elgi_36440 [Paenibacillus elgii]